MMAYFTKLNWQEEEKNYAVLKFLLGLLTQAPTSSYFIQSFKSKNLLWKLLIGFAATGPKLYKKILNI